MDTRVFELRTYHTHPGKLPALHTRFTDHTIRLLEKHGMTLIGFWTPTDPNQTENTVIYLVAHASLEATEKNWQTFRDDPVWMAVKEASEKDGPIVVNVDRVFMKPTEYSALK